MTRRWAAALLVALGGCAGSDDSDDTGDDASCPEIDATAGVRTPTLYTVRMGDAPITGARLTAHLPNGELGSQGTTGTDGTVLLDVADGDLVTVDPSPDTPEMQRNLQSVLGVEAGVPLVFQASYAISDFTVLPDLPVTLPALGDGEWSIVGYGPCLLNTGGEAFEISWAPECVELAEAGGMTEAPLIIWAGDEPARDTTGPVDVQYIVIEDLTLGATDPLSPSAWSLGTPETLSFTAPGGGGYVRPDRVSWWPVVGPIVGARFGGHGHYLAAEITDETGRTTLSVNRAPLASDTAMMKVSEQDERDYTVFERVESAEYGAPIAVDNTRTLTGTLSATWDAACGTVTWTAGSPAADYVHFSLNDRGVREIMVPPGGGELALPDLLDITEWRDTTMDIQVWETDLAGVDGYLAAGDDSTLPDPPRNHQRQRGELIVVEP